MTGKIMFSKIKGLWQNIRRLSGDDAYERYLQHYLQHQAEQHAEDAEPENTAAENSLPPLSREEFFKQWQDKKWKGIKRCC
ncbi:MAG: YbdD/YjiX family protein [Methylotenera sp.]